MHDYNYGLRGLVCSIRHSKPYNPYTALELDKRVMHTLLANIRFYVEVNNEYSKWRIHENCLTHGSVLSPVLFNIYTNDQSIYDGTRSIVYAD